MRRDEIGQHTPSRAREDVDVTEGSGPATLKDVAARAGVGIATASVVVNGARGATRVSDETRQRILDAARALRYSPNGMARALKKVRLNTLGLSFHTVEPTVVTNPYSAAVLEGVLGAAHAAGYNVTHFHKPWKDARQSAAGFRDQGIDGFLIVAPYPGSDMLAGLSALGIPLVVVSSPGDDFGVPSVGVDNTAGIDFALRHLLNLGHRRVGFLAPRIEQHDARVRRDAFSAGMAAAGLPVPPEYVATTGNMEAEIEEAACAILSLPEPPTALIAANDRAARAALSAAASLRIPLPAGLSVVGFDDAPFAAHTAPPLTTVRQPVVEIGREATRLLIELVEGRDVPSAVRLFRPELVVRGSTAAAPTVNRQAASAAAPVQRRMKP